MVVQFLSKINKLKAMNKGQVSTEIATLVRGGGGGVLSTELYNIYIYIYVYIYRKSEFRFFHSSVDM